MRRDLQMNSVNGNDSCPLGEFDGSQRSLNRHTGSVGCQEMANVKWSRNSLTRSSNNTAVTRQQQKDNLTSSLPATPNSTGIPPSSSFQRKKSETINNSVFGNSQSHIQQQHQHQQQQLQPEFNSEYGSPVNHLIGRADESSIISSPDDRTALLRSLNSSGTSS